MKISHEHLLRCSIVILADSKYFRIFRVVSLFNYQCSFNVNAFSHQRLLHTVNFLSVTHLMHYVNHFLFIFCCFSFTWPFINGGFSLYNLKQKKSSIKITFYQLISPSSSSPNSSASMFIVCRDLLFLLASSEDCIIKSLITFAFLICINTSSGCVVSPV